MFKHKFHVNRTGRMKQRGGEEPGNEVKKQLGDPIFRRIQPQSFIVWFKN